MTDKCKHCNGEGFEPGLLTCAFCDSTGVTNGIGVAVPMVELKPFKLLPYGTKFRYQGTSDVWVRTQHNIIAEWPCRIWSADGTPRSSLCCFCHLDGDEDGNTLDTLVEVVDQESELTALREERDSCTRDRDSQLKTNRDLNTRNYALQQLLTIAEQRNADLVKAATEFMEYAESGWDHFPDVGVNLRAAIKATESGVSE